MRLLCFRFLFDQLHVDVFGIERPSAAYEDIHNDAWNDPQNISKNGGEGIEIPSDGDPLWLIAIFLYRNGVILCSTQLCGVRRCETHAILELGPRSWRSGFERDCLSAAMDDRATAGQ